MVFFIRGVSRKNFKSRTGSRPKEFGKRCTRLLKQGQSFRLSAEISCCKATIKYLRINNFQMSRMLILTLEPRMGSF